MGSKKDYEKENTGAINFNQNETSSSENDLSEFVDNSPEAIEARKLQEIADNSHETIEGLQYQESISTSLQQNPNQNDTDVKKIRESYSGDGQEINGVIVKYKTKKDNDGYYKLTYPDGTVQRKQPHEFEFYAKKLGHDTFYQSIIEEGFSVEASVFLLALGANESNFGIDNGGDEYHNMFSIMGGSAGNIGTSSGNLQKFDSWEDGFSNGFVEQIVDGYRKEEKKFPLLRNLLESNDFSIDDINKAFGQYNYHKHNEDENSAPNSYDGNEKTNFGLRYTKAAIRSVIPMMILDLDKRVQDLVKDMHENPNANTVSNNLDRLRAYRGTIKALENAKATLKQKIADYEKEQEEKKTEKK